MLDQDGRVLGSVTSSQWELNTKWKGLWIVPSKFPTFWEDLMLFVAVGIVPALAARAHSDNLPHVINAAIEQR